MPEDMTTKRVDESDEDKLDRFKTDIQKDADIQREQRLAANEDMRFINVTGGMWEDFLEPEFQDRTKLEFDIVSDYVNRFIGEWNLNRAGVEYKPDDSSTSDDDAELLNGIYRADFRQFSGKMSLDNAVDEQATCGYGSFKLGTKFEDDEDPENDLQRIEWRPIFNSYNTVYWEDNAKRIDKRDAKRCTELKLFTKDAFKEAYPDKKPISAYEPDDLRWSGCNMRGLGVSDMIYIAKRYDVIREKETVFVYNNLVSGEVETYTEEQHKEVEDELKKDELKQFVRERKVVTQHVETTVFSGDEILEDTKRIAGKFIPIISIYGYRNYVDGVEWYRGLVRKLKDAARLFNMQVSQLAENSASTGQEVPIFDPDQMEGDIAALWADRNNKPYLLARALRNDDGTIVHHGPTSYLKPAQLDGSTTALMQLVPGFIQQVTGGAPQDTLDPNVSGKAIRALRKREDLNTQVLNDNINNAIEWSGVVYQAMAAEVYSTERIINTIGQDGTEGSKHLLKTVVDEETGKLIEANNLNGKKFRAYSDTGPQYDTLREQTVEDLKGMLDSLRETKGGDRYADAILSTLLDNITGVNLGPLKELNRRNMLLQGLVKPETDEEKQFVAQAQQPKEDPNQKLLEAAANQQNAEARNLDSDSLDNAASAEKKQAETAQIISDIRIDEDKAQVDNANTLTAIRERVFKNREQQLQNVQRLPF